MDQAAAAAAGSSFASGRKGSIAGSVIGMAAGPGRKMIPEFEFTVGAAKAKVLKAMEESVPQAFARFYDSSLFDSLLHGLIIYFCAIFQHEVLSRFIERSKASHTAEGCNLQLVSARLRELQEEATSQRTALSQPYCEIILKHSSYKNQQQDKQFFETLYSALAAVLREAFERLGKQPELEQELGRLFRGKHFNMAARVHGPQRSVDTMTVMQMWQVKNETSDRALHSQLISSLFERAPALSVQVAAVSNSPLVSQAVSSPMVARSLLADPAERDALLELPYSRKHKSKRGGPSSKVPLLAALSLSGAKPEQDAAAAANSPRTTAASPLAAGGQSPSIINPVAAASVVNTTPVGPRASTIKPFQSTVASLPEAAGLPYDEGVAYLCLLRRAVLYGPTLGLPTGPPNTAGRSAMMSITGAAPPLSNSSSLAYGRS